MNRTGNDVREIYLRLKRQGIGVTTIARTIGRSRTTVYTWNNVVDQYGEEKLFSVPDKSTRTPLIDLVKLELYIQDHPFKFDREIAEVFNVSDTSIGRWRKRLGITRKQVKTKYQEADTTLQNVFKKN